MAGSSLTQTERQPGANGMGCKTIDMADKLAAGELLEGPDVHGDESTNTFVYLPITT